MSVFILVVLLFDLFYDRLILDKSRIMIQNRIIFYILHILGSFLKPKRFTVPQFSERQINLLFGMIFFSALIEFAYFGVPLFSGVSYNEFGFPILHHVSLMGWMLVFFSSKNKINFLIFHFILCFLMLNRQYIFFSLLAFLFSYNGKKKYSYLIFIFFFVLILALGILRNNILEVEFNPLKEFVDSSFLNYFDFVFFFIVGPYVAVFGSSSMEFNDLILLYWNTLPEWRLLTLNIFNNEAVSFVLFYTLFPVIIYFISRIRNFYWTRYLLPVSFVYIFFTFFSRTLLTTNLIACLMVIIIIDLLTRITWSRKKDCVKI